MESIKVYGVSPDIIVAKFTIILYQGLVLTSGSILGALLHANKDWLTAKQIYFCANLGGIVIGSYFIVCCSNCNESIILNDLNLKH